jgi:cobalt-zinc-cadmium efflux system protein
MHPPHEHANHHHHHGETTGRVLWLATGLTLAYAGVEAGVGGRAGSLALVADAGYGHGQAEKYKTLLSCNSFVFHV